MRLRTSIVICCIAACFACAGLRGAGAPVHPLDRAYTDPRQFSFLTETMKNAEVVSLAESIHMTHEFPLVRLGMIRELSENLGFGVLAMEGSAVDLWATQDRFLNSNRTVADATDAQLGLFGLWNTAEIREIFEYAVASWGSRTPLYITAYDVQPGTGKGTRGTAAFQLLASRLANYAVAPASFDRTRWVADLEPLTNACHAYRAEDHQRVEGAIRALEQWVALAQPEVAKKFPHLPHALVLGLVPENLRMSLALCDGRTQKDWGEYKSIRDAKATQYVLRLKDALPLRKLMLWAHISHLSHNSLANGTSVGQLLHQAIGDRLYTVGVFAESGGAILIYSDVNDDLGYAWVHADRSPLGRLLRDSGERDYFMNLRQAANPGVSDPGGSNPSMDSLLTTRQLLWAESGMWPVQLAKDFDGIVWIKTVHAPGFPLGQFLLLSGLHYTSELEIAGVVLLAGIAIWSAYRLKRRRKRREKIRGSGSRVL